MYDRERFTSGEASCQGLATRVDLAVLRAEFKGELHALESRLTKWMIGLMLGSITAAAAIATAVDRFAG